MIHLLKDLMPTGFPPMLFQICNLIIVRLLLHITQGFIQALSDPGLPEVKTQS